jgi:PKD repeat protein
MKELYMGYYEGVCQNAFTQGQADRMHFFLNSDVELSNIISPANQTATGIDNVLPLASEPIVDFTTDKFNTCLNSAVSFSTESIGCITSWNWTFPGATPSTSTDPNPTVQYNIAGTFPVILQVSNGTNSVTISKNSYIKVEDAGSLLPLNESFESSSFPPPGWRVVDFEEDGGWERKTLIASEGSASLSFPAFDAISCNSDDDLISPLLDLTNIYTASLSFDFAYKPASLDQNEGDALLVQVLDACGQTFPGALFDRNGFFLASEIGFEETAAYSPAGPASWQNFTASLDNYAGSRIYLRFRFSSKQGQNFFLDNIRINGINTALEPLRDLEAATQVLPNPFTQGFDLNIQLPFTESIKLEIVDLQGKSLYRRDLGKLPSGAHRFDLSDGAISQLAAGVYFLNLETPTGRASKKIMKL